MQKSIIKKNLKIKLIYPPHSGLTPEAMPPYGIGVLAAFLRKNGYEVKLEDLSIDKRLNLNILKDTRRLRRYLSSGESSRKISQFMEEMTKSVDCQGQNLVGFSIFSYFQLYPALLMARCLKKINKDVTIIFGGPYTTICWSLFFYDFKFVDYAIRGEGEIPLLKLINYLEGKISITDIPGLVCRIGDKISKREIDPFDIENESAPDFTGLPLDSYRIPFGKSKAMLLPYRMSKGCVNRCNFCVEQKKLEVKPVNKVIAELKELTARYESNLIYFTDLLLNFSHRYLREFCCLLIKSGLHISWGGNITVNNNNKSLLFMMKQAGCSFLQFGIESGSNRVLRNMGKRYSAKQASTILKDSYDLGLKNVVFFIAGYPHETITDLKSTINFIRENDKYIFTGNIFRFKLLLNSSICTNPEKFGIDNIRRVSSCVINNDTSFDEIDGLGWKEKKKQQERFRKAVYYTFYKKIISQRYRVKFIPFYLYLFLEKIFYLDRHFTKLLNYSLFFLSKKKRFYSSVYSSFAPLYYPEPKANRGRADVLKPKAKDFYRLLLRIKNCEGLLKAFKFFISLAVSPIFRFRKIDLVEFFLDQPVQDIKLKISAEIKKAQPNDYDRLKKICGPMVLGRRLARGDTCFIAIHNGIIVSNAWFTSKDEYIYELEREIELKKDEVYGFGLYVHPRYRNLGIGTAVAARRFLEAKKMGYKNMIAAVVSRDTVSQYIHKRLKFRPRERIVFIRIFGFKKFWSEKLKVVNRSRIS